VAGHNKWSKIKHRKAAVEKKKTRLWSKISRAIMVAARNGGGDPTANLSLRYAIDEARYANMPRDTIERAIKKGAGEGDTSSFEAVRYEGYAPGGVAVVVDALTDNRTRTIVEVRNTFSDHGGNVGASGCVAYMFQPRGEIVVSGKGLTEDRLLEVVLDAGALDVQAVPRDPDDDDEDPADATFVVTSEVGAFATVRDAAEAAGLTISQAHLTMIPETTSAVRGDIAKGVLELLDALEDLDDVQKVYSNADIHE
jgi:YebC/PmpR family DNA-binding regulatory protein